MVARLGVGSLSPVRQGAAFGNDPIVGQSAAIDAGAPFVDQSVDDPSSGLLFSVHDLSSYDRLPADLKA
jgi:hypothetical protein